MPRQLKILKGLIEEDPSTIRNKISILLGETVETARESLRQLSTCLHLLLNKDEASKADQAIIDLGVRFWNDIRAANTLIYEGLILNAMMMERDAIETICTAEYLHKNPQEADTWQAAKTLKERRHFELSKIKTKIDEGSEWKALYDDLSSYIHPNRISSPAYSRNRPYFGHNLYLGSFYDPAPIIGSFLTQLAICINFIQNFMSWYKDELPFPTEFNNKIDTLDKTYHDHIDILKKRADEEQRQIDDNIQATRFSKEEIIKMFQFLDTLS